MHDLIISVGNVDRLVDRYRADGTAVQYLRDLTGGHISLGLLAAPLLENWVADRFADRPLGAPTTKTVLSLALSPAALSGYASLAKVLLRTVTGSPIRSA